MKDVEYYRGREQTYLKHFFLEQYLERVAYVIGYRYPQFVYVDGFSGPWKSDDQAFEDTSFIISINKLRQVRDGLSKVGKRPRIRCLFIESGKTAFRALENAVNQVSDLDVKALHGDFEKLIPDVLGFVGGSFSLVFIDPTGWTGFGLRQITPILEHRPGEVLVNFMFDHINRFFGDIRPEIVRTFDNLFGGPGWAPVFQTGRAREDAIVELYRDRLRAAGTFKYVTSTRVLKPISDRSYFYLVYGTRHVRGLLEFREVERKVVEAQESVRLSTKQTYRIERTRQTELFTAENLPYPPSFEEERATNLAAAASKLRLLLRGNQRVKYQEALGILMEIPLVWEQDTQQIIKEMRSASELEISKPEIGTSGGLHAARTRLSDTARWCATIS